MALADLSNPTVTIADGSSTFDVGPLSLADLAELRRQHVVRLLEAFDAYKGLLLQDGQTQRAYGAVSIFLEMADAVAHVIALAAREPDRVAEAARLPVGTQIEALTAIAHLSLTGNSLQHFPADFREVLAQFEVLRPEEIN